MNIKDVAKLAGVSIGTVSNVLNDSKPVSDELRNRVLAAVEELNYTKNVAASALKTKKTGNIGVVFTSLTGVFFPAVLRGIQSKARELDYSVCVYESGEDAAYERKLVNRIASSWIDGLIIASFTNSLEKVNVDYWKSLENLSNGRGHLPVVNLEWKPKYSKNSAVIIDQVNASKTATRHLIELGHKVIGFISGPVSSELVKLRHDGYMNALEEAGLTYDKKYVITNRYSPLVGYNEMQSLLEYQEMTAVVCGNDQIGVGAVRAAISQGMRIPEDIAVIGFDNSFAGSLISPSLSTINVPSFAMGTLAMEQLHKEIEAENYIEPRVIELPARLVIRQSTDLRGDSTWNLTDW